MQELLWKQFSDDATPPRWIKQKTKPAAEPGKVVVTCLKNSRSRVRTWSMSEQSELRVSSATGSYSGKLILSRERLPWNGGSR